ncbi:unnamed protein product [Rotaria socialis]
MQSHQNPMYHLMNIDKLQNRKNKLVKALIASAASLIDISEEDVLNDAFYLASRETFTYAVLFDESLNSLPIHAQAIIHLKNKWKSWESTGIHAQEVSRWQSFTMEQTAIIHHIWTLVIPAKGSIHPLDGLFDATHRNMKAKMEMNDKVVTCIDAYCQQASDKDAYYELVRQWHDRFDREVVKSIEISPSLKRIVPFAEKFNQFANVRSWRAFLNQQMTINGKF